MIKTILFDFDGVLCFDKFYESTLLPEDFDVIVNSADHGLLKQDQEGELFKKAISMIGESLENSLLIDDSHGNTELYKKLGGESFQYKDFNSLEKFISEKLSIV